MSDVDMSVPLTEFLNLGAKYLCSWLGGTLPTLNDDWWKLNVVSKLSYQQRERVERVGITLLEKFDLAALLRVMDHNWYDLGEQYRLSQSDRIR